MSIKFRNIYAGNFRDDNENEDESEECNDNTVYCPRCGEPMDGGVCDNCGFPVIG